VDNIAPLVELQLSNMGEVSAKIADYVSKTNFSLVLDAGCFGRCLEDAASHGAQVSLHS
jgi:uncharacterized protein YuzB (UPF0349 family)